VTEEDKEGSGSSSASVGDVEGGIHGSTIAGRDAHVHIVVNMFAGSDNLRKLCSVLDVDYESLSGDTEAAKVAALVRHLHQVGQLGNLVKAGQQLRPDIRWDTVLGEAQKLLTREDFEPETVYVPAGPFWMGSPEGEGVAVWETPQHEVDLSAYWIGKYPVTNEQYAEFVRKTGRIVPPAAGWEGQIPPADRLEHPVSGVTWYDALAYCEWLSEQTGRHYGLPSEAQWEKAARGTDRRIYPWGNEWDPDRCNHGGESVTAVDAYPEGKSPYGCYDMVGNVREWTRTVWGRALPSPEFRYPWANDRREDLTASKYVLRVYRGGDADRVEELRCSARGAHFPDRPGPPGKRHGFRIVLLVA
jgi:formylglycine-generating enzyme required for sulfatase activity